MPIFISFATAFALILIFFILYDINQRLEEKDKLHQNIYINTETGTALVYGEDFEPSVSPGIVFPSRESIVSSEYKNLNQRNVRETMNPFAGIDYMRLEQDEKEHIWGTSQHM